MNLSGTFFVS